MFLSTATFHVAGTLGCAVARCLMGWGVQHITLADNGRVAYSNPVRQSLFTFEDCKGAGRFKAEAAASALRTVYPGAKSTGHVLTIPMPGHPLAPGAETEKAKRDTETLEALVSSHDVVFVLTDSRESRWLPTLLSAKHDKICINAALGLDSFLVVRHGGIPDEKVTPTEASAAMAVKGHPAGTEGSGDDPGSAGVASPSEVVEPPRLGCYFCTDVVAPENSSLNRTLDQQCTVTRPGLAPMAAATAVEMTVGLLHHPLRQRAPADDSAGQARGLGAAQAAAAAGQGRHPLGALPHQVHHGRPLLLICLIGMTVAAVMGGDVWQLYDKLGSWAIRVRLILRSECFGNGFAKTLLSDCYGVGPISVICALCIRTDVVHAHAPCGYRPKTLSSVLERPSS